MIKYCSCNYVQFSHDILRFQLLNRLYIFVCAVSVEGYTYDVFIIQFHFWPKLKHSTVVLFASFHEKCYDAGAKCHYVDGWRNGV